MPSISYNRDGGKITWDKDDWLAGLHPNYSSAAGDTPAPIGNAQLTFSQSMNPYRYFGYASPGFNPTDVTGVSAVTDSPLRHIVIAYDTDGTDGYYGFGINSNTKIFRIDTTTGEVTSPHTITSASGTVEGNDIVQYAVNIASVRTPAVFYSFNNTGATAGNPLWNVGMCNLAGTYDDDFMTTVPASPLAVLSAGGDAITYPHPMIVGDDDILYIADANVLNAFDGATGANGTYSTDVLTLPAGYRITSFAKLKQRLVIFAYKELRKNANANPGSFFNTETKAFFWNYLDLDPYDSVDLNDNYCSAGFNYMGTVGCFTQGRKPVPGSTQFSAMKIFNGDEFDTVAMFDDNIPIHGGVQVVGDTIMFCTNTSGSRSAIYQFGSPYPGFPDGLNKVTSGTGTSAGALCSLSTTLQVVSTGTGTSGGLQKLQNNFTTGSVAPALASPVFSEGHRGVMKSATVTFGKASSGGRALTVSLVGNNLTNTTIVAALETVDSTNIRKKYEFQSDGALPPQFDSVHPVASWGSGSGATDAPIVQSIELEYQNVNLE